jgi:hypothetical protein
MIRKAVKSEVILGLDGKERKLTLWEDDSITFRIVKDGKTFGRIFNLPTNKIPTWINESILKEKGLIK